jgi:glycosyltransferase involved in cell wall biosynthesis
MKISLISTVKNEVNSVDTLFESIIKQTQKPDEIVIVDAGSVDGTLKKLFYWKNKIANVMIIAANSCNRSVGRNRAIAYSSGEVIAATDFGCTLTDDWLSEITKPIIHGGADVTAGYYLNGELKLISSANSYFTHPALFEIDQNSFLPSTRSIAFKKECWKEIGGFDANFIFAEDTLFSGKLRSSGYRMIFNEKAVVIWNSENSIFVMMNKMFSYSKWDGLGSLNEKFYYKKIILILLLIIMACLSVKFNFVLFLLLLICAFYSLKTFFKALKKRISISAAILVVFFKPLYDFVQSTGFLSGKLKGTK